MSRRTIVKYLVKIRADINKETTDGETILFNACFNGNIVLVQYLVEHGADINKERKNGETPFFYVSIYKRNKNISEYLMEHGADINKGNCHGVTSLYEACFKKNSFLYIK